MTQRPNWVALDLRVLVDIDPDVWVLNYGNVDPAAIPRDMQESVAALVQSAIMQWIEQTGNVGRVQIEETGERR